MMQWLIDIVYDAIVSALGHVWDIKDIVPDDQQIIIGDGSIWKGELISSLIARYPRFVDRGDPAAFDWVKANFIKDANWRTLDISGVVPAGAQLVLLWLRLRVPAVGQFAIFRNADHTDWFGTSTNRSMIANLMQDAPVIVGVDASRHIEYYISVAAWTNVDLVVRGWWL